MGVQRYTLPSGAVRYRARVKSHGREVATRVFERKADAVAWEQDQRRRLRLGEWIDPRRGQVPLSVVAADWLGSRSSVKRRTRESDEAAWRNYIAAAFRQLAGGIDHGGGGVELGRLSGGPRPGALDRDSCSGHAAVGPGVRGGRRSRAAQCRGGSAQADQWPCAAGRPGAHPRRGWPLTEACKGRYRDVVPVLALAGLRWGELAGLQVGDRVSVPGPGLRLRRAVLASSGGGALYVDTLKNNRARTVPLVMDLVPIVDRWSEGKAPDAWLFDAPEGGPLRESNWKRSVGWSGCHCAAAGIQGSAFTICVIRQRRCGWAAGADPKVVQRVLGHATAAMTMDLYGHLMDANLWQAARLVGDISGTSEPLGAAIENEDDHGAGAKMPGRRPVFGWSRLSESNR